MAKHTDMELVRALIHDAHALCAGAGEREIAIISEELGIAELMLSDGAEEADRSRVYELLHPSTLNNFLS